jgi:hypothetical protein
VLLVVILPAMFCFGFDRVVWLESLPTLGIGGCIRAFRGLLRRFTATGGGCGSAISTLED